MDDLVTRLVCAIIGHRWQYFASVFLDGKTFPAVDQKRCNRCGESKADLFFGGL